MTEGASTSAAAAPRRGEANQPWIEKYRPKTLGDVAANKEIIDTIQRLTDENRLPHLLLYGPPGAFSLLEPCQQVLYAPVGC
jgi:replication factor C subunit 3/5